jgi:hypothetical protein
MIQCGLYKDNITQIYHMMGRAPEAASALFPLCKRLRNSSLYYDGSVQAHTP